MATTNPKAAKAYYKSGHRVTIGGVPCRMSCKPGPAYRDQLKASYHGSGFDRVSADVVREAEVAYALERLEALGVEGPKMPPRGYYPKSSTTKAHKAWQAATIQAYLDALAALGRPQSFTEAVDESEPMLDLEPAVPAKVEETVDAAPAVRLGRPAPVSPAKLQEARVYAAESERRLIDSLKSGETQANDPASWIAELQDAVKRIESGEWDGNFTVWQRMTFFLTGTCEFLLGSIVDRQQHSRI